MTAPTPDESAALLQAMAEHGIRVSDRQFEKAVGALLAERDALRADLAQARARGEAVRAHTNRWAEDARLLAEQADRIDDDRAWGEAGVFRACIDDVLAALGPATPQEGDNR